MDTYLEKAEECLREAEQSEDISDRYSWLRKAEIYVKMAEVTVLNERLIEIGNKMGHICGAS